NPMAKKNIRATKPVPNNNAACKVRLTAGSTTRSAARPLISSSVVIAGCPANLRRTHYRTAFIHPKPPASLHSSFRPPPLLRIRPCHLEDDDFRSKRHPGIEIDDILIHHADTPGRDGLADTIWLRGSVNAVSCVFPVFEQIERTRAKRIADAAFHAFRPFRVAF